MKVVLIIVAVVVLFVVLIKQNVFPIITVCGDSMFPTYHDGEILVGNSLYPKKKLKAGDVILYYAPNSDKRIVIKRIDHLFRKDGVTYFYCLGDNPPQSCDSRNYGFISQADIICKVVNQRANLNK